jgi:ubiquitin-activating enzyme E1
VNRIKQLLHSCPIDKLNSNGTLFWSGAKKPPSVVPFDINDPLHMEFLKSAANLRASCYGIEKSWDDQPFIDVLSSLYVPVFTPSDEVKIASNDEEAKAQQEAKKVNTGWSHTH